VSRMPKKPHEDKEKPNLGKKEERKPGEHRK
jgi:hypothetical protein